MFRFPRNASDVLPMQRYCSAGVSLFSGTVEDFQVLRFKFQGLVKDRISHSVCEVKVRIKVRFRNIFVRLRYN